MVFKIVGRWDWVARLVDRSVATLARKLASMYSLHQHIVL
jgi:hypothetical protein